MTKNTSMKKGYVVLLLLLAGHFLQAQQTHAFSVKEAVDYAHKNNTRIKNALLDLQIQLQTNKSITSGALPSLSASAAGTDYFNTPVQPVSDFLTPAIYGVLVNQGVKDGNGNTITLPTEAPAVFPFSLYQKYNANAGLQLQQTLFDGTVFVGLKARKASIDYAQKAIDLTEENIRVNIYKVYYQLVVSKTSIEQINANIDRAEKLLHDAGQMYSNGFSEKLDVDRATVQLANLQTQQLSTQNTINNGYLGLKYLLGMPIKDSLILTDNFTEDDIKNGMLLDTAYRYEDRNDYQSLQLQDKLNGFNIRQYQYSYYPTLKLNGAYQKNAFSNTIDFFSKGGTWYTTSYLGLNINVPIFSGFAKDANLKKARLQQQQVRNQMEDLRISIDNDVAQAQNSFRTAIITVDNQRQNKVLAESVYNQTKKKYESGLASNTDITNAQTDLVIAQTNFVNALYNAIIAKIDYLKAIGKI
jgi:outer membrane protein